MKTPQLGGAALVGALAFTSAQVQQAPLPVLVIDERPKEVRAIKVS